MFFFNFNFVSECFEFDAIFYDMAKKILKRFPHPTVCISYSLRSKAIHMGFSLHATATLDVGA